MRSMANEHLVECGKTLAGIQTRFHHGAPLNIDIRCRQSDKNWVEVIH